MTQGSSMSASENGHTGGYTPGPWEYTVEGDGDNFKLMGGEVYIVGGCGCCGSPFMDGPHEANARLIATAPEMLEALKHTLKLLEPFDDPDLSLGLGSEALAPIRAAIANAEGRRP